MRNLFWAMLALAILATTAEARIKYKGGDGSSYAQAVVISNAKGEVDGVASEYDWLAQHYPGYRADNQALVYEGDKIYDVLTFQHKGKAVTVYFDITGFFGKF